MALSDASAILEKHTFAKLKQIEQELQQFLANSSPTSVIGHCDDDFKLDPRIIYCLHANAANGMDFVVFRERLGVATLLEVTRACQTFLAAHDFPSWVKAAQAMANARALSEWIYVVHTLLGEDNQSGKSITLQNMRAAVKTKIKKAKSAAAKKGWRKTYKADKQLVVAYYEQHKSKYKSLANAADDITKAKLVPLTYSTVYTWLLKHTKKQNA